MTPRGTLLTCLLLGLVLVGCEALVVPPESTATPEDVGAAPGPIQVEMTIVLTDGTLLTAYTYRDAKSIKHAEVVRWQIPASR